MKAPRGRSLKCCLIPPADDFESLSLGGQLLSKAYESGKSPLTADFPKEARAVSAQPFSSGNASDDGVKPQLIYVLHRAKLARDAPPTTWIGDHSGSDGLRHLVAVGHGLGALCVLHSGWADNAEKASAGVLASSDLSAFLRPFARDRLPILQPREALRMSVSTMADVRTTRRVDGLRDDQSCTASKP